MYLSLYTENIPDLPGSGAICSAPVSVDAEIWKGRNPSMSRKVFSLKVGFWTATCDSSFLKLQFIFKKLIFMYFGDSFCFILAYFS